MTTRDSLDLPLGGFNRAAASHRSVGSFYDMLQLRPARGKLIQTDPLISHISIGDQVRFNDIVRNANGDLRYLTLFEGGAKLIDPITPFTQVSVPVVLQVAVPNIGDSRGECLLYGISTLDFAADDDQIDVEIDADATFQWRKNGGSWTTGVSVGSEVNIGTALKLSFMETSGYTVGSRWSWKRTDYPYTGADATTVDSVPQLSINKSDIYIGGVERNILRLRSDVLTSVGYKRVYGKYCRVFQNHLVVGQYAPGAYDAVNGVEDTYDESVTPFRLGWSHLNNPDQLFATDLNEADTFDVPTTGYPDTPVVGITGMELFGDLLYIYLPDSISVMRYLGLPLVMKIDTFNDTVGSRFSNGLVKGARGHYFIGSDDFYLFDGSTVRSIGEPVRDKFFDELVPSTDSRYDQLFAYYDRGRNEVSWTYWVDLGTEYQCRQVVFLERDNIWFFRNLPDVRCQGRLYNNKNRSTFGGTTAMLRDGVVGTDSAASFVKDKIVDGAADEYTQPVVQTQIQSFGGANEVKELREVFVDASYVASSGVRLAVSKGSFVDSLSSFANVGLWVPTLTEARLTFKPESGRCAALKFTFEGSQPLGCNINRIELGVLRTRAEK